LAQPDHTAYDRCMRWDLSRWRTCWLALLAACALSIGCGRPPEPERGLERLRADVATLQVERERMAERLSILEMSEQRRLQTEQKVTRPAVRDLRPRLPVVRNGAGGETVPTRSGEAGQSDEPFVEQVEQVEPVDPVEPRPTVQTSGAYGSRPRRGADGRAKARLHGEGGVALDVAPASAEANRAYEAALTLVRAKKYDAALDAFTSFLVRYPDHPGADRAMYWRGECLFAKGDVARAQEQYEGILARFPFGTNAPDALLKLGMCQRRLGATAQAEKTFADLKGRYPNSDAARQVPRL
jgi:tol-pal system protein YbgF